MQLLSGRVKAGASAAEISSVPPRNALLSRKALALDPESTVNRFVCVCFKQEKSKV